MALITHDGKKKVYSDKRMEGGCYLCHIQHEVRVRWWYHMGSSTIMEAVSRNLWSMYVVRRQDQTEFGLTGDKVK
jgi:hypothetical protein